MPKQSILYHELELERHRIKDLQWEVKALRAMIDSKQTPLATMLERIKYALEFGV